MISEHDVDLPFDKIHEVITSENIFVLKTEKNDLISIDFDYQNTDNWIPLLQKNSDLIRLEFRKIETR